MVYRNAYILETKTKSVDTIRPDEGEATGHQEVRRIEVKKMLFSCVCDTGEQVFMAMVKAYEIITVEGYFKGADIKCLDLIIEEHIHGGKVPGTDRIHPFLLPCN